MDIDVEIVGNWTVKKTNQTSPMEQTIPKQSSLRKDDEYMENQDNLGIYWSDTPEPIQTNQTNAQKNTEDYVPETEKADKPEIKNSSNDRTDELIELILENKKEQKEHNERIESAITNGFKIIADAIKASAQEQENAKAQIKIIRLTKELERAEANSEKLKEENNALKTAKNDAEQKLTEASEQISELESENKNLKADIQKLKETNGEDKQNLSSQLDTVKAELKTTEAKLSEKEITIQTMESKLNQQQETADSEINSLKQQLSDMAASKANELKSKEKEITDKQAELDDLAAKNEAQISKLTELNQSIQKELEQAHTEHRQTKEKLAQASAQISRLTDENSEITRLRNAVKNYQVQTSDYIVLVQLIYNCPCMEQYIIDKDMPTEKPEDNDNIAEWVIPFIAAAGAHYSFARDVVNYMVRYKKLHKEAVTKIEMELIHAVNQFYLKKYQSKLGISDDEKVLIIPDGMENNPSNCNVAFRKNEMQDIDKPISSFRTATVLYAPAFREFQNKLIAVKACVAGK